MKRIITTVALVFAGVMMFSCGNSADAKLKKDIVGTFSYQQTEAEDNMEMVMNGLLTFNADGTSTMSGDIDLSMNIPELAMMGSIEQPLEFSFKMDVNGKYDIKDGYIIYNYDFDSFKMDISETASKEMTEMFDLFLKPVFEMQLVPAMKQELLRNPTEKIVEITEEKMVLESLQGQVTYSRVR